MTLFRVVLDIESDAADVLDFTTSKDGNLSPFVAALLSERERIKTVQIETKP